MILQEIQKIHRGQRNETRNSRKSQREHAGELGLVHVHDPSIRKQEYKKRERCFTKVVKVVNRTVAWQPQ